MSIIQDYVSGQFSADEQEEVGIGGFTLLARVRERTNRTADVPTTFLEDGSHVNDHIIRNPLTISIEGNVSDVHVRPSAPAQFVREIESQVGEITQYIPARTVSQLSRVSGIVADVGSAIGRVDSAIQAAGNVASALGFGGAGGASKGNIEAFLDTLDGIYASGVLIDVDMPFRTFERMSLTSMEIIRDNQSTALNFNLEFQQFRFVQTQFVTAPAAPNPSSQTNGQTQGEADKGTQEGEDMGDPSNGGGDSAESSGLSWIRGLF